MNGELFRGITDTINISSVVGSITSVEVVTFSNGATAAVLAVSATVINV